MGGNDARCVIEISQWVGGKNCLKFCIMSAMIKELIALTCCDNPTEREYFSQMITHRTSSIHNATCTFTCRHVQSMLSMAQDVPWVSRGKTL